MDGNEATPRACSDDVDRRLGGWPPLFPAQSGSTTRGKGALSSRAFPCCLPSPLADMPSPLPRRDRVEMMSFNSPTTAAFPEILPGRLPHLGLSRPAQRSLTLRPAYSLSRQMRPVASKASTISLPPSPLRLLPAGTTVAGRDLHPLKRHALARRTVFGPYASSNAPRKTEFSA